MSGGPRPVPVREVRAAARRQAAGVSATLWAVLGAAAAVAAVAVFVVLDYRFDQATHRLVKIILGGAGMAAVLLRPRLGLFLIPVVTPFLPWFPVLPIPGINALNVLLGSVFLTWALSRVLGRQTVFRSARLGWILGAVVVVGALSVVRGTAFPTGYEYETVPAALDLFRSAVTFSVYFIALAMARGERDRRLLAGSVVLGLLAEAVCTIAYGRSGPGGRAVGSIGQSNELGAFLAMYAVLAAALLPAARGLLPRLGLAAAVAAGAYGVLLSLSRGGVIALVAGLLYVAVKTSRLATLALLAVLATGPLWAPDFVVDRLTGTQVEVEGTDATALDNAAQVRVDTWRAIIRLVTEHPIDGVGFSGLQYVLPSAGDALGLEVKDSAHNTFLRFLGEMGILGLGLFLFLLWRCWRLAMDGARAARSAFDRRLAVGLAASTLAMAVSCAFGDRFFNILITGNYWIVCALVNDLLLERRETPA